MNELIDLRCYLQCRLEMAEIYAKQEMVGQAEIYDHTELLGRIKEIKKLIAKVQEYIDELREKEEA